MPELAAVVAPLLLAGHHQRVVPGTARFSVITPMFDARARWIAEAATSLANQTFPDWEWILVENSREPGGEWR